MRGKSRASLRLIEAAQDLLAAIQPASVRAVSYQLFMHGRIIPDMSKGSTNRVSEQLKWARENGVIPWDWVVDETRDVEREPAWADRKAFARAAIAQYRIDRWTRQKVVIPVWSEKGTVRGTIKPIMEKYGIGFQAVHGYSSATMLHQAAVESAAETRKTLVLYVGDYDPSGCHMSEVDIPRRLAKYGGKIEFKRLALIDTDLTDELPSFPVTDKKEDKRYKWWCATGHGSRCWELDAMNPVTLRQRIEEAIRAEINWEQWETDDVIEAAELDTLTKYMNAWAGLRKKTA